MRVVWTAPADMDRERIVFFIAEDNPDAALAMDELLGHAAQSLARTPLKGRPGRVPYTREWVVHKNYVLIYQHDAGEETIYIVAVLHTARQWPPIGQE